MQSDPVQDVRAPKAPKPLPKALSVDHSVALAEHRDTSGGDPALAARDTCIVELLYGSGLRIAERVGLDVQGSAAALGWIDLPGGEAHVLGKGSKRRSVPVGSAARAALQVWLPLRAALAKADQPALFVGRFGTRLTPSQIRSRLKTRAVQELLGHANITTTQVYTRLDFGHLSKVYDAAHPRAKRKT